MNRIIPVFLLASAAFGATLNVCNSGCAYPNVQAAFNASNPGDVIVLAAGQNAGSLTMPGGVHNLTFKSSAIDSYPRGYRITRSNPALARITTVTMGDSASWVPFNGAESVLENSPGTGGAPMASGFNVGDQVVVTGSLFSAYACAILNQPPYTTGACPASRVGYINIRTQTGLANGMTIYFRGQTLPPPLVVDTPYYVINFQAGNNWPVNADQFQIAATPGGAPIDIPQFNPSGQDFNIEVPPLPLRSGDTVYVTSTPTSATFTVALTPGGPPITFTQTAYGYNGATLSAGFTVTRAAPVHDITFDGIEILPQVNGVETDTGVYYPFYVSGAVASEYGEHYNIKILRSWIHSHGNQTDFPMTMVALAARASEIGWSIIEGAYSTSNDTQCIGLTTTGDIYIHDNELVGATENIMSGGNTPWFILQRNPNGFRVERNYSWKPLSMYIGVRPTYVDGTHFQLLSAAQGADCSTVANSTDLGYQCFAYESNEYNPAAPVISRTNWTQNATASTFTVTGQAAQEGYLYLQGGQWYMVYNFTGSVSCPTGWNCSFASTPAFPAGSTRIGIAIIGSGGTFDGGFYQEMRNPFSKNHIESKIGDNWQIFGNVFSRQSDCDGGGTCQSIAIRFVPAATSSANGAVVNYLASSSYSTIQDNIFRMLSAGVNGASDSYAVSIGATGLIYEWAGFGVATSNTINNNLFYDLGSTEYSPRDDGFVVNNGADHWQITHNTAADISWGFVGTGSTVTNWASNILTPYRSACPDSGGNACSHPAATTNIGMQYDSDFGNFVMPVFSTDGAGSWMGAVNAGYIDPASTFLNNIMMNRAGFVYDDSVPTFYPANTYLIQTTDTINGANPDPSLLFQVWNERVNSQPPNGLNYRTSNFRLQPGIAAAYPAADARAIGADIDEIEALTGQAGIDVERGWPKFSDRVSRQIIASSSSAVMSYLPNGYSCAIEIWSNSAYAGTPALNIGDGGADLLNGILYVSLNGLLPDTTYYGKRWCGPEVDVFTFTTTPAALMLVFQLAPPSGAASCQIAYGSTPSLGSFTPLAPVTSGTCNLPAPQAEYTQPLYLSASGQIVARGNVQRIGL